MNFVSFGFVFSSYHTRLGAGGGGGGCSVSQFRTYFGARGQRRGGFPAYFFLPFVHAVLSLGSFSGLRLVLRQGCCSCRTHGPRITLLGVILSRRLTFRWPLLSPGMVASCPNLASLSQLRFRNPQSFRAEEIHNHLYMGTVV